MKYSFIVLSFLFYASLQGASPPPPKQPAAAPWPPGQQSAPAQKNAPFQKIQIPKNPLSQKPGLTDEVPTEGSIYTSPGIVTRQGSDWVGSENLYNISPQLGVEVEIIKPPSFPIPLSEDQIKEHVITILQDAGLSPRHSVLSRVDVLPFLHVLMMIQPIDRGFAIYCAVRLFEEVQNKRVFFKPGITWQGILWEKQELVISPPDQIQDQVNKTLDGILSSFVGVYKQRPEARQ